MIWLNDVRNKWEKLFVFFFFFGNLSNLNMTFIDYVFNKKITLHNWPGQRVRCHLLCGLTKLVEWPVGSTMCGFIGSTGWWSLKMQCSGEWWWRAAQSRADEHRAGWWLLLIQYPKCFHGGPPSSRDHTKTPLHRWCVESIPALDSAPEQRFWAHMSVQWNILNPHDKMWLGFICAGVVVVRLRAGRARLVDTQMSQIVPAWTPLWRKCPRGRSFGKTCLILITLM